jgi:hypothetical protein
MRRSFAILLAAVTAMLSACGGGGGGGGGGSPPPPAAPSSLSYSSPQALRTDAAANLAPTVSGTVSSYSVTPALPSGLALNGTTGVITGTPTVETATATYAVSATNAGGSTTFGLVLRVDYPPNLNDTVGTQPDYSSAVAVTRLQQAFTPPLPSPRTVGRTFFYRYGNMRGVLVIDINRDGVDDLFVAPSFFENGPRLPVEVWINNGDGTFRVATADWIVGAVPTTAFATSILNADFNLDGRDDIFIADSGLEERDCAVDPCDGAQNTLLLSTTDGRLTNATSSLPLPANNPWFNHVTTGAGDFDGNGLPDVVVPRFNDKANTGDGVAVFSSSAPGVFQEVSAQTLSDEVAFLPFSYQFSGARPPTYDRQGTGAASILDVNGDAVPEVITCSYSAADRFSQKKTIRIHAWNAGAARLQEVGRFEIPPALAAIVNNDPGIPAGTPSPGCSNLAVADIDHDLRPDLLLQWETWGHTYVHVARGLGNYQFQDVTLAVLGSYETNFSSEGFTRTITEQTYLDVNGDTFADIVYGTGGVTERMLIDGSPATRINDGTGKFVAARLKINGQTARDGGSGCRTCSYGVSFGRFFARTDGRKTLDLLLWSVNEDRYTSPDQERWVVLRALRAR